ncbi:MAG: isoleucine--tRNA ligase, partial [Eggerthellaceae bacterium]|nr:isoleucine--tRNA ligase [Eggerthellaceae bacterium]
ISANRPDSVQLAGWPVKDDFVPKFGSDADAVHESFVKILAVRDVVTKALEEARANKVINKSQEAKVIVSAPKDTLDLLKGFDEDVYCELFIVSCVEFASADELGCVVEVAQGEKCPRCWNITELVKTGNHAGVCKRCADVLHEIGFVE